MSTLAFIPARGGSKGVKKKNIKLLAGKPLIAWSIEQAKACSGIDRVLVSTDCDEIADIAKQYGADVPFLRPADISGDLATTESAMLHCCEVLESMGKLPDTFILMQATSPIRLPETLDQALCYFNAEKFDSLLTVTESHRFIWQNKAAPEASYDYLNRPRRQDITEKSYLETGSFYITNTAKLLEYENRLCGNIGMFETHEIESYEIDTLVDFQVCERLMQSVISGNYQ